jgi:hypothetical protein
MTYIDRYYIDSEGGLHFLSALDQESAVSLGLVLPDPAWSEATPEQISAAQSPSAAQSWASYQARAQEALSKSDIVAIRCVKAGVLFPPEWQAYCISLRAIVGAASGDSTKPLPTRPPYPSGT